MSESSRVMRLALALAFTSLAIFPMFASAMEATSSAAPAATAAASNGSAQSAGVSESAGADAAGQSAGAPAEPRPAPAIAPSVRLAGDPLAFMFDATTQIDAGAFGDAVKTLESGITDLEREGTRYDARLIKPLVMLGDAYQGVGDYPRARETYVSALHIERVNEGLHSPGQAAIVYKEADALAAMGDFDEANVRHEYAFEVLQRAYGPTSVELVPGIYKLAEWYVATRNVFGARPLYERARDNLERAYGPTSPELVPALRGLAETYRYERFPPYAVSSRRQPAMQVSPDAGIPGVGTPAPEIQINRFSEGERALQEVIAILDTDKANQPVEYALAVLDLADWNLLFEKWERAAALYAHVDSLLRTAAKLPESEIAQYLGQPTPLYLPLPADPSPPPPDLRAAPKQGYVELAYSLSERGEVEELRTVGSDPEGLMDIGVRKAFRSARFRPALDHGVPIAVPAQTYRHAFSYYPRRAEVRESEAEAVDRGA